MENSKMSGGMPPCLLIKNLFLIAVLKIRNQQKGISKADILLAGTKACPHSFSLYEDI